MKVSAGVDGGIGLAGAVICVNEVELRLMRLIGERKDRRQLLVDLDGAVEIVLVHIMMGGLVERLGARLRVLAMGAAGQREHADTEAKDDGT